MTRLPWRGDRVRGGRRLSVGTRPSSDRNPLRRRPGTPRQPYSVSERQGAVLTPGDATRHGSGHIPGQEGGPMT